MSATVNDMTMRQSNRDTITSIVMICLLVLSAGFFWQAPRLARVTPVVLEVPTQAIPPVPMPPAPLVGLSPDVGQALKARSLFAAKPPAATTTTAGTSTNAENPEQAEIEDDAQAPVATAPEVSRIITEGRGALRYSPLPEFRPTRLAPVVPLRFDAELVLVGIATGRENRAIIATRDGQTRRLTLGQSVNGWQVSSIGETRVILRKGREEMVLRMPE